MAAATTVRATQGEVLASWGGDAFDLRLTMGAVLTAYKYPSTTLRSTQGMVLAAVGGKPTLRNSQSTILVLWAGRRENRKMRAWGFSLDGHDFYVLRLGESATLVHDMTTGQWSRWATNDLNVWRAHLGLNWGGVEKVILDQDFKWNIVGGDDSTGVIWLADPTAGIDEDTAGITETAPFDRKAIGVMPMRLREGQQCGAIYLTAALGSPTLTGASITLRTSDDNGYNWVDHGDVVIASGNTTQEISWLGLGLITAPGRIFEISDAGGTCRLSSLDMRP